MRKVLILTFLFGLVGCYGRPNRLSQGAHGNSALLAAEFGLKPGQPAVVSFSALWCHPCREEIDSLNQGQREFDGLVQFKGFLLEGEEKGSTVVESDLGQFTTFSGVHPTYTVGTDSHWRLFDALRAPDGRALPTLVVFDKNGQIQEFVQQSLDYQSQLRPLLIALARGEQTTPVDPTQNNPPVVGQMLTDTMANWLSRAEVAANRSLIDKVTAAWRTGLQQYAFTDDEMPLANGKMTFVFDGRLNTPQMAKWISDTAVSHCQLQLNFKPDGKLGTISGFCRPK